MLSELGFNWDLLDQDWQAKYQKSKDYIRDNGDAKVPQSHPELGLWIGVQRSSKKNNKLPADRLKLLNEINFIWDPADHAWKEKYIELKQYVKENGHAKVPASFPKLGKWVFRQRNAKRRAIYQMNTQISWTRLDLFGI